MQGRHAIDCGAIGVVRRHRETISRSFNRIRIAIAAGTRHGERAAGGEPVEIGIGAVLREVHAFRLRDGVQIHLHARGGDGLSGHHAGRGRGLLQVVVIDADGNEGGEEQSNHAHNSSIVAYLGGFLRASRESCTEFVTGAKRSRRAIICSD